VNERDYLAVLIDDGFFLLLFDLGSYEVFVLLLLVERLGLGSLVLARLVMAVEGHGSLAGACLCVVGKLGADGTMFPSRP
jgi:hypothetical protein